MSLNDVYFTGSGSRPRAEGITPTILMHPKTTNLYVEVERSFDDGQILDHRLFVEYELGPEGQDMPAWIEEMIQILHEWRAMLVNPDLTGQEPQLSKHWERLPHESDEVQANSG